ncbi:MAG: hypothetical protein AB7F19_00670 [Candidatus Babeliales bacterium]
MQVILTLLFLFSFSSYAMKRSPDTSKIAQAGQSVVDFLKGIPKAVQDLVACDDEFSSSPSSSSESAVEQQTSSPSLTDSPPKTYLKEEVEIVPKIPKLPTMFKIQNDSQEMVQLVAVLTAELAPKKYMLVPGHCMDILAPNHTEFQEVQVPSSHDGVRHLARYHFKDGLPVHLAIMRSLSRANQLVITKKKKC